MPAQAAIQNRDEELAVTSPRPGQRRDRDSGVTSAATIQGQQSR
jgi:hypothetical protein